MESKKHRSDKIAVLLPCYNEEVTIAKVVRDFREVLPQATIYVFDNCSTDQTSLQAQAAGAEVIYSPLQGKGNVVKHMFDLVEADIYIMADGDDTYPAEAALPLIERLKKKDLDMVVGNRLGNFDQQAFRAFHQFGNKLVARLISLLFPVKVQDVLSGLRVFSRRFVKTIPILSEGFEIETEITLQAITKKYFIEEMPIHYRNRPAGSYSKLNTFSDGLLVIKSIFLIFKDYRPLVFYFLCGIFFLTLSLLAGYLPIMEFYRESFVKRVPLAILAASFGLLGILFIGAGLILDTVAKYHKEKFQVLKKYIYKTLSAVE